MMHTMWMTDSYERGPAFDSYMFSSNVWRASLVAFGYYAMSAVRLPSAKDWPHTTLLIAETWE